MRSHTVVFVCCVLCGVPCALGVDYFVAITGDDDKPGTLAGSSMEDGLSIWTVTETRRVVRDDPAGDGTVVNLAAARNEWEGFQILVRSDTPVDGLTIEAGDLTGPAGAQIVADDVRLYRQHQVEITEGSWRNYTFTPGWYSDALIPFKHPLTGDPLSGAEYTAVPFDLPADQTHGFWVDVPVSAASAPGAYMGTYLVKAGDTVLDTIPVQLTVWDFELPRTPTLQTDFGSPKDAIKIYYENRALAGIEPEPADYDAVRLQCNEMMARHGLSAFPKGDLMLIEEQPDGSFHFPQAQVDAMQAFIDTSHVNSVRIPTHMRSPTGLILWLSYWGIEDEIPEYLAAWDDAIDRIDRPQVMFYNYLYDEPNDLAAYDYVRNWGTQLQATGSTVEVLVVEQTLPQPSCGGDLYGAVSVWCPGFATYDETNAHARQAAGEHIWTYTALAGDDYTPKWLTDFPLIEYRVPAWTAWRFDIEGLLYWTVAYWHLNLDLPPDPWTDPKTFENEWMGETYIYNGDGCIVYPGRKVGYEGIAPSIRLKALRDSVEDYEYLAILERMGLEAEAMSIVQPFTTSWYDWVSDPAAYEQARVDLATLIESHTLPGDMNRDGWVDLTDYESFEACFTGPGAGPVDPACTPGDFDGDDDIDCTDWSQFVLAWNAYGEPPLFPPCDAAVPALSQWSIVVMTLLTITAGTVVFRRRIEPSIGLESRPPSALWEVFIESEDEA